MIQGVELGGIWIQISLIGASHVALVVKNPLANAADRKDMGSIPGWGRASGGGHGNLFQYSFLENPIDRGARWATVHSIAESDTTEALSMHPHMQSD